MYSIPVTTAKGVVTNVGALIGGKVALIVNTASQCGFTPQLKGLQELQASLGPERFTVIAYPCNQFLGQEPGGNAEIETFCSTRFASTFPIMAKCNVNEPNADPLWTHLKSQKSGLLGFSGIQWNFSERSRPHRLYPLPYGCAHRLTPPLPNLQPSFSWTRRAM